MIASVLLTAAAFYYTASHLSINTDTDSMINADLQFRQEYGAFNKLFPQLSDNFVIVVDAPAPELQTRALELLAEKLSDPKLYKSVFIPGYGAYFEKNGITFLSVADLEKVVDRIAAAQPLLSPLAARPTLDTLFDQIASALDSARRNGISPEGLEPVLEQMAKIAGARAAAGSPSAGGGLETSPAILSWQNLVNLGTVGAAGRHRFVIVQPALNKALLQPAKVALTAAREAAAEIETLVPGSKLSFTGKIALNNEELKSVSEGAVHASLLSFVAVALILVFGIGSIRLVLCALTTLVMGLIWTAGFAIFTVGYLNIVSVAFAVLFIGIGVDFAIHFILRFQEELGHGNPHVGSLRVTGATAGKAIALGAPTTALAFFAFTPTDYHGLAQLGLISGTGIFIAVVTSLTVLPALCALFPAKVKPMQPERHRTTIEFLSRHAGQLLAGGGVITFVALIALPRAGFDFDPIRLKDQSSPSVKTYLMLAADGAATPYSIQILVPDDGSYAAMKDKLLSLPQVSRVVSIDSFVPKEQEKKSSILADASFLLGDLGAQEITVPVPNPGLERDALGRLRKALDATAAADKSQLAQSADALVTALDLYVSRQPPEGDGLAGLREAYVGTLPQMLRQLQASLSPSIVSRQDLPADLVSRYVAQDGRLRLEVFPNGNASDQTVLRDFVNAVSAVAPDATGSAVQVVRAGEVIVASMREATLLAIGVITLFLFVVLRNPQDVALVVLPVAIATVATTAATVWFNVPFNFANVIALPLIIGLGVTGGTQIVIRARQDSRAANLLETNTPKAVVLSALTNIASFASLAVSSHWGTASMGILLAIGLIFMLLTTLILLPALLTLVERVRAGAQGAAEA